MTPLQKERIEQKNLPLRLPVYSQSGHRHSASVGLLPQEGRLTKRERHADVILKAHKIETHEKLQANPS